MSIENITLFSELHAEPSWLQDLRKKAFDKEKIEAAVAELETAAKGEDKAEIEAKIEAVIKASEPLMQAAQAKAQQAGGEQPQQSSAKDDGVVDAEFEEVKDNK